MQVRLFTMFFAILLAVSGALQATAQVLPDRPPVIMIPGQDDSSEPVHVRSLDVDARIVGFLAETTVVMTFHNPNDRILEGELVFPLPEGATVSGYGLDVGGELVDGVVVERQRARVAFEAETRVRVDPGLAEWVQGSTFRTRIYPFPANGSRTIKLQYVSDLTVADGAATYDLPLAYQEELERFHIRVAVSQGRAEPTIVGGGLSNFSFAQWESQFVAETTETDMRPREDLRISVPVVIDTPLVERADSGDVYFAIQDVVGDIETVRPRPTPNVVAIIIDLSGSRTDADLARERALIHRWAEEHPSTLVDLYGLSDRLRWIGSFSPGETRADDLVQALAEQAPDGGTDLRELFFPPDRSRLRMTTDVLAPSLPETEIDYYILFSDGLGSLGAPLTTYAGTPVVTVTSTAGSNHAWLRHLAEGSGGAYINLQRLTDDEVMESLAQTPLHLADIEITAGTVEMAETASAAPVGVRLLLAGRLTSPEATISLHYELAGERVHTSTYSVAQGSADGGDLVPRYWAQLRIGDLALQAEENREGLLELGRTFNMVTPETSYIVLETLEQHLEHHIPPAPTRGEMLAQYNSRVVAETEDEAAREAAKVERVVQDWEQRVAWWRAEPPTVLDDHHPTGTTPTFGADTAVPEDSTGFFREEMDEDVGEVTRSDDREAAFEPPSPAVAGAEMPELEEMMGEADVRSRTASGEGGEGRRTAMEDTPGPAPADGVSGESTIAIQAWDPQTPYLAALQAVSPEQAYGVYLDQKHTHGRAPAFYLDVASYLYRVEQTDEARRVLTNISELELGDARLLRVVAYKLQEEGDIELAIRLFEEVLALRPEEPQSVRDLALALAERAQTLVEGTALPDAPIADWVRALELIDQLVRMENPRFYSIEMPALMEANRIIARMDRYNREVLDNTELPALSLDERLRTNLDLDIRVILRWDTDDTDMDLWVTEPSGERCYYGNTRTAYGAMYGRDYTGGYGPEEYLLNSAPDGDYRVQANFFGSRQQSLTGGTTLQVDVFTDWGRPTEKRYTSTIRLTDRGETLDIATLTIGDDAARLTMEER